LKCDNKKTIVADKIICWCIC